jgi:hypothetical protein
MRWSVCWCRPSLYQIDSDCALILSVGSVLLSLKYCKNVKLGSIIHIRGTLK